MLQHNLFYLNISLSNSIQHCFSLVYRTHTKNTVLNPCFIADPSIFIVE